MAKSSNSEQDVPRKFFLLRPKLLLALTVIAMLGWGMHRVWQQVEHSVIYRDQYMLSADHIEVSELPDWITGDVRAEVVQHAGLDRRLSMLDHTFTKVVRDAFALHPWVESVDKIVQVPPVGVQVDLTYRRPIAVVEMAGQQGMHFVPIDKEAVHLPERDVPEIRKRYLPRIGGIVDRPPVGQKWADERVTGSAALAVRLSEYWKELHLVDIIPSARPEIRGDHRYYVFELLTRGGTRIVWGAAPDLELPGEDSFQNKLGRLKKYVASHMPLDSERGPAIVDVRRQLAITPRTVKRPTKMKQAAKEKKAVKQAAKEKKDAGVVK